MALRVWRLQAQGAWVTSATVSGDLAFGKVDVTQVQSR